MEQTIKKKYFSYAPYVFGVIIFLFMGVAYYFYNQSQLFVETDNALLTVDYVTANIGQTGILTKLNVENGSTINKDDALGIKQTAVNNTTKQSSHVKSDSTIPSPIKGTVLKSSMQVGQMVMAGQPLAVIADLSKMYILAYIDESLIADIGVGKDVDVTIDAYKGQKYGGKVTEVGSTAGKFAQGVSNILSNSEQKKVERVPVKIALDSFSVAHPIVGLNAHVKIHK